jgi:hypothetical protein
MPMTDVPPLRKPHPHFQPAAAVLLPLLTDFDRFKGTFHNEFDKPHIQVMDSRKPRPTSNL